jgi:ribosomal-protein-alanine N-acetyltransferase
MLRAPGDTIVAPLVDAADLEGVLAVDAESFVRPWTRAMYEAELRNAAVTRIFVIRVPGVPVAGYCATWFVGSELHINNLAIRPEFRRQRLASRLLDAVLDLAAAAGCERATLEVRRSNHPARQLYESLGFRLVGVRRDYYSDPVEDALILWRDRLRDGPAEPSETA